LSGGHLNISVFSDILSVGHPSFSVVSGILSVMGIPPVPIPKPEKIQLLMYDSQLQTWIKAQLHDELHSQLQTGIKAQLHDELHSEVQFDIEAQLHDELQPEKIQLLM